MASLPQGGINLEARNFQAYIKKLQEIDKQQRAVFERDFKGTDLSYNKLLAASRKYQRELNNELKAIQRAERERAKLAEQAEKAAARAAGESRQAANVRFLTVAGGLTAAAVGGFQLAKQGAAFEAQQEALSNLAGSYGQASSEIVAAMQRASGGVLSNSAIIQASNKALLLEVAQTPEQFERVTRDAIVLGRALGLTASESIDQFTTALGRKSILILDNFGLKMAQVNEQLDRLGRERFGVGIGGLSQAQKDSLFIEAALAAADERVQAIGDNSDTAAVHIERMAAGAENAKTQFGLLLKDIGENSGLFEGLGNFAQGLADSFQSTRLSFGGGTLQDEIEATRRELETLKELQDEGPAKFGDLKALTQLRDLMSGASDPKTAGNDLAEQIAKTEAELNRLIDLEKAQAAAQQQATGATDEATDATEDNTDALKEQEAAIKAQQNAIRQAESIALNFARAQEDAARKLQRAQEKLERDQTKARDKLLKNQQKQLDKFEADAVKDRAKQQADAVKQEAKIRKDAAQKQQDDQAKLFRDLKQAQDRYNLDRLQSRRRFNLSDRRLRAEGDILGLQELRENFELEQQEAKENFGLQQKETRDNAQEQKSQTQRDTAEQLAELRAGLQEQNAEFETNLAERRQELLTSFDEQFADLQESQQEQHDELQRSYQEQLEDLNLSRQRQLEDLGRSLVEQEGITKESADRLAQQLEEVFGVEGIADTIMTGFTERQTSGFQDLFDTISKTVDASKTISPLPISTVAGTAPTRRGRLSFADGGIVPGPSGAPVPALVHAGEMVLNQGQQTQVARMLAPVVQSQNVNVNVNHSGGFDARGMPADVARELSSTIQAETLESVRIAMQRVVRRG